MCREWEAMASHSAYLRLMCTLPECQATSILYFNYMYVVLQLRYMHCSIKFNYFFIYAFHRYVLLLMFIVYATGNSSKYTRYLHK